MLNKVITFKVKGREFQVRIVKITKHGITLTAERDYLTTGEDCLGNFKYPVYAGDIIACVEGSQDYLNEFLELASSGVVCWEHWKGDGLASLEYSYDLPKVCAKFQ